MIWIRTEHPRLTPTKWIALHVWKLTFRSDFFFPCKPPFTFKNFEKGVCDKNAELASKPLSEGFPLRMAAATLYQAREILGLILERQLISRASPTSPPR